MDGVSFAKPEKPFRPTLTQDYREPDVLITNLPAPLSPPVTILGVIDLKYPVLSSSATLWEAYNGPNSFVKLTINKGRLYLKGPNGPVISNFIALPYQRLNNTNGDTLYWSLSWRVDGTVCMSLATSRWDLQTTCGTFMMPEGMQTIYDGASHLYSEQIGGLIVRREIYNSELNMNQIKARWLASFAVKPTDVFILSGQSNAVGHPSSTLLTPGQALIPPNVEVWVRQGIKPVRRIYSFYDLPNFGPEVSFIHTVASAHPERKFLFVKYGLGSTSLYAWSPNWTCQDADITQNCPQGFLYKNLMESIQIAVAYKNVNYAGFLWAQGETDSFYEVAAQNYGQNLETLVMALRLDLKTPELPFLLTVVNPPPTFPWAWLVAQAQIESSTNISNCYPVSTLNLPKVRGYLHYSDVGQIMLGERFADTWPSLGTPAFSKVP